MLGVRSRFSEADGVKPAVPFFHIPFELQNSFFVAPQGQTCCPLSDGSAVRSVCQLVDFLTSSTQTGPQMQQQACQSANSDVRGEEACLKHVRAFKALFEVLADCCYVSRNGLILVRCNYNREPCHRHKIELPDWFICMILHLLESFGSS